MPRSLSRMDFLESCTQRSNRDGGCKHNKAKIMQTWCRGSESNECGVKCATHGINDMLRESRLRERERKRTRERERERERETEEIVTTSNMII